MGTQQKVGELTPGFTPELGARIEELYRLVGGQGIAAKLVGVTGEQARKWKRGKARMPLLAAVTLCERTGRSLDWLASGGERSEAGGTDGFAEKSAPYAAALPLDEALLADSIALVLEATEGIGKSPEALAHLVARAYALGLRDRARNGS